MDCAYFIGLDELGSVAETRNQYKLIKIARTLVVKLITDAIYLEKKFVRDLFSG